jgi:NAD(P)-dependent dehydrogenase (short-subunit alcohol dehydrogenase family)
MSSGTRDKIDALVAFLEDIASNRGLLSDLSPEERTRLIQAAGRVYNPDPAARRHLVKAIEKKRRADRAGRDERKLHDTGIRALRRQPVFTTPNVFAPPAFDPQDVPPTQDFADLADLADHADDADRVDHDEHVEHAQDDDARSRQGGTARVDEKHCYVCKQSYTQLHHFYDQLCPDCARLNFAKRTELADLTGRIALLTGGRVKIGYQTGLKLLRCGARLIVTTRFPRDAAARYAAEPDFESWGDRLEVFGLDLRHTPSVEAFCHEMLVNRPRLDFIVNNACQTVRRPPAFYEHMMASENAAFHDMPAHVRKLVGSYEGLRGYHMLPEAEASAAVPSVLGDRLSEVAGLTHAAQLSQVALLPEEVAAQRALFPEGRLDQDLQQIDLRGRNSWRLLLSEVSSVELLEVQLVNAVAPFIFNARLKPLMMRTPDRDKHIVNVSAVEGQFYRRFKTTRHPHTNMAKAALNMMTRTSATDYQADGIHMNSVDTGWVTDEDPAEIAARKTAEHRFHPPLDIVDGAARIVDPIISGINTGVHVWGQFLKDYRSIDW